MPRSKYDTKSFVSCVVTDIEPTFRLKVPEYGSRFPSTGLLLGICLGPGSQVQIQVPEYREIGSILLTHTVCRHIMKLIHNSEFQAIIYMY